MAESHIDDDTIIHDKGRIYGAKVARSDENCGNWDTAHGRFTRRHDKLN